MKPFDPTKPCLCQSGKPYLECCGPYHASEAYPNHPEALMRSRYAAFCINKIDYLKETWHPETLPNGLEDGEPNQWIKLEILDSSVEENQEEGQVEFKAYLIFNGKLEVLHENSDFIKVDEKWVYHSGEFLEGCVSGLKIKKSEPCPCGSGKLFKNCHG